MTREAVGRRGAVRQRGARVVTTWIALLRGVNVGGVHRLPMADLRAELTSAGLEDVATYIQSGNVVFRSSARSSTGLATRVGDAIEAVGGFRVPVLVLSAKGLERAAASIPLDADVDPKSVMLWFLFAKPRTPDLDALRALAANGERFRLEDRAFALHAPSGIGRSKLAAQVERKLGVEATARNLRTVRTLIAMARDA